MNARITPVVSALIILAASVSSLAQQPAGTTAQPPGSDVKKPLVPATLGRPETVPTKPANVPPQPQGLAQKPADPAKVRATYEIGGARVNITEGEFYDCQERLKRFEPTNQGRALTIERVYEQILAYAEAKALGLDATPEEIALFDPLKLNPELAKDKKIAWEREGVTQEMYDIHQRETRSIQKAKDLFLNSVRLLSTDVYEAYRRDHYTYRLEYVDFPASRYAKEIEAKPPTNEELERFWKEDKAVQQQLRGTANVTVEFVSFDPSTAKATGTVPEIPEAEAIAYYAKNKARLDLMIPSEERANLTPSATVPLKDLPTPFRILMKHGIIAREILLSAKMREAFEEAKKPGADLSAIAAKSGLTYEKVEKADRDQMVARYAKYGPQIFSILFNMNPGDLSQDLKTEPQIQFFYRVLGKEGATLPDFEKVRDQLLKPYTETQSLKRAQQAAFELRQAIDKRVDQEVKAEEEQMLAEARNAADADIKARNVTDPKEIENIKNRRNLEVQTRIRAKRDALAPKHFAEEVKSRGLKLSDTGTFEFTKVRRDVSDNEDAMRTRFLITNPLLKSMEPNTVSQVLTDAATRTHYIVRLVERSEPDYKTVPEGELLAIRSQTERGRMFQPIQRWQYQDIMRRRDLKVQP
jgi:hypothetical protein